MPTNDLTTMALVCSPKSYLLGGTVSGLTSGTLVLANGTDTTSVSANGNFQMPTAVAFGASYAITVQSAPAGLTCSVSNSTGIMPASNQNNISVLCSPTTYTIGGSISGLRNSGLVLANGSDTLNVAANATSFTMPTAETGGSTYNVTVAAQPTNEVCSVTNGTSAVAAQDVSSIQIICQLTISYTTAGAYTFTVPSGVTALQVIATGGGGGSGSEGSFPATSGGNAAQVTSTLTVQARDTVNVYVAGGGRAGIGGGDGAGSGGGNYGAAPGANGSGGGADIFSSLSGGGVDGGSTGPNGVTTVTIVSSGAGAGASVNGSVGAAGNDGAVTLLYPPS